VRVLLFTAAIVIADQATKLLVKGLTIPWLGIEWHGMPLGTSRPILGDFVRLTYVENAGMAFGIDLGAKLFFSIFSLIASVGIVYYLFRVRSERLGFRIALAMILGGAIGNLIDRVFYGPLFGDGPFFYGRVVDFLDVDFFDIAIFNYHLTRWPVFNIADASVTLGVLLVIGYYRVLQSAESPLAGGIAGPSALDPGESGQRASLQVEDTSSTTESLP
jgi:signal peptidase II